MLEMLLLLSPPVFDSSAACSRWYDAILLSPKLLLLFSMLSGWSAPVAEELPYLRIFFIYSFIICISTYIHCISLS